MIVVAALLVAVYNLDHPWVKARVQAAVRTNAGVDIDYRSVRLRLFGGIEIDDLVVRTPAEMRGVAGDLARAGKVEAAWSTALYTGRGRRVDAVTLTGVTVTVVVDEQGRTSFDALSPPDPKPSPPPSPPTPLSHRLGDVVGATSALPSIDVRGLSLSVVRKVPEHVEHVSVAGLAIHAAPEEGGRRLRASVGSPAIPTELVVTRTRDGAPAGSARAAMWLTADATGSEVAVALDVAVHEQTFAPDVAPMHVAHVEAGARFDPAAGKTAVTVTKLAVGEGVASATAAIDLPDNGAPLVHHAEGDVDLVRLLAIAPRELIPFEARLERGDVRFRVERLGLGGLPRLTEGAEIAIDADLAAAEVAQVKVSKAKLDLHVEPGPDAGLHARASLSVDDAAFAEARAKELTVTLDATQASDGALRGKISTAFAALARAGVAAKDGAVDVTASDLLVDPKTPLATRGDVTVSARAASFSAPRLAVSGLAVRAHTRSTGRAPFAVDAAARADLLRADDTEGKTLVRSALQVQADLADVFVDEATSAASRGTAHVVADAGEVHVDVSATKAADSLTYALDAKAATLAALRPLLPPDVTARTTLERTAVAISSKGRVDALRSTTPSLAQHAELVVDRPAYGTTSARKAALSFDSKGSAKRHEISGELRGEGVVLGDAAPKDDRVTFRAMFDRDAASVGLELEASGRADAKILASIAFDRARRAVTYDVDAHAVHLAALAPLAASTPGLAGLDLSGLELSATGRGALLGVVADVDALRLEPAPTRTAAVDGTLALTAKSFKWRSGATAIDTPSFSIDAKMRVDGGRRVIESEVEIDELHLASGRNVFDVVGAKGSLGATVEGDLADPDVTFTDKLAIQALKQNILPWYPVGNATLAVAARRGRDGVVHVKRLELENGAAGSSLALEGALDMSEIRGRVSLHGKLQQDLARVSNVPERFVARGIANVALRLDSPDFTVFHTVADVRVADAYVRLPASGVTIEDADGEVPITFAVRVGRDGVQTLREDADNPYSSLRFADQHPLLSRSSFISVRKVTLPQVTIAPLVGNMQIQQNIVSLRQFEMGIRGGRVTGQCALDWNGEKSTIDMHVRADGVQSSHGEPFAGSAALVVSAAERSIDGRADIRQIGKRHLQDLMDLQDPFHADPAIEKIRSALKFGYPDKVRVTFNHGFASVHVGLGGLARLFSVGELRGIPIGPLVDKMIPVLVPSKEAP